MPSITILAPDTPVSVPSMKIVGKITEAHMRRGVNPLTYRVEWVEKGALKSGTWPAMAVEEIEPKGTS